MILKVVYLFDLTKKPIITSLKNKSNTSIYLCIEYEGYRFFSYLPVSNN